MSRRSRASVSSARPTSFHRRRRAPVARSGGLPVAENWPHEGDCQIYPVLSVFLGRLEGDAACWCSPCSERCTRKGPHDRHHRLTEAHREDLVATATSIGPARFSSRRGAHERDRGATVGFSQRTGIRTARFVGFCQSRRWGPVKGLNSPLSSGLRRFLPSA
jgi:hypothetical protein